ncbi:unnamed protein product, partial [Timema podura]|nr:unnamed protein product [Timema podura]
MAPLQLSARGGYPCCPPPPPPSLRPWEQGHDTMTSAICFALWCLAKNQDVQDMVLKEIESVVECKDRSLVYRDLQEMKYLEKVIKETLRLFPSVAVFGRKLNQDVQI